MTTVAMTVYRCPLWVPRQPGGAKAWLHVQDFEVDAAFDLGLLKGQRIRNAVAAGERWLMRRFDVVSTISQRMHQRLLAKGVDASKARLAVNRVDISAFSHVAAFSHVIADRACPELDSGIRNPWMPGQARHDSFGARHDSYRAELRQRLGAAGYAYALAHLDRDAVLQKFEADVLGLLQNA